jgi:hypothetical protein
MVAEFGERRDHAGVDAGHQRVGFLSPVVARWQTAGTAGHVGHVGAPLIEDQVEAGAQAISSAFGRAATREFRLEIPSEIVPDPTVMFNPET